MDCSELSKTLYDIASHHMQHTKGVNTVDQAIDRMTKDMPHLNKERIILSIAEATTLSSDIKDALKSVIDGMKSKGNEEVKKNAKKLEAHLKKPAKEVTAESLRDEADKLDTSIESADKNLRKMAGKWAKFFVEQGANKTEDLVGQVHQELLDIDPDLTAEQTRAFISGYGQFQELSKDQDDKTLRQLKAEMLELDKLESMEQGMEPLATGREREAPTEEKRRLQKLVNDAKNKGGYAKSAHAKHLKSAAETVLTSINNSIKDMKRQLGRTPPKKDIKDKRARVTSPEIEERIKIRDALRKEFKATFRTIRSESQRTADAVARTKKTIERYQGKLVNSEFQTFPTRGPIRSTVELANLRKQAAVWKKRFADNNPFSPSMKSARSRVAELRGHLANKTLPPPRTDTGEANNAYLREQQKLINDLKEELKNTEHQQYDRWLKRVENISEQLKKTDYAPAVKRDDAPKSRRVLELQSQHTTLEIKLKQRIQEMTPRTLPQQAWDVLGLSRVVMTSLDLSGLFRQGAIVAFSHPKKIPAAVKTMLIALRSEKGRQKAVADLRKRRNAPYYVESGLYISDQEGGITKREEAYATTWLSRWMHEDLNTTAKKIRNALLEPLFASERAYVTILNTMRADTFDILHDNLTRGGTSTAEERATISQFVNITTGRGELGFMEKVAGEMNVMFFAPRYVASRFQYPAFLLMKNKKTGKRHYENKALRNIILQEYARYAVGMAAFYGLTSLAAGDDDEFSLTFDPRSSDFGKLKFGDTRIDPLGGLAQPAILTGRLATREKETRLGIESLYRPKFGRMDVVDLLATFTRTKLSPIPGAVVNIYSGKNVVGEDTNVFTAVQSLGTPMALSDVMKVMEDQGYAKGTIFSALSILGMGVQVYD